MLSLLRCAAFILAALGCAAAPALQLQDDRGVMVDVPARPLRIVALSPHLAEIVYAAGAGPRLAAVVRYSDYPAAAARLPRVGEAARVDVERIVMLQPDLILAWRSGNPRSDLERLERRGLPVFVTEPARLADIARLVRRVGALAGTSSAADAAASAFERELEALRLTYSTRPVVRVFYEIWHRPLLTVNAKHLISDVLALCGGVNVFADAAVLTPAVSLEAVLAARAQLVLGGGSAMGPADLAAAWRKAPVAALRALPVRYVPPDLIQRQTPRIVQGARLVCEHLEEVRKR